METAIETTSPTETRTQRQNHLRRVRPVVDVFESDVEYLLQVELPGVVSSDVQLTVEHNSLRLEATRRTHVAEPVVYDRSFTLPEVVDGAAVGAELASGVLTVKLPKRKAAQPRQIEVKAS